METLEPLFTGNDLRLIEALEYDPSLEPGYDCLKDALIWVDERPDGLTNAGWESLGDLWAARSYIHQGRDFSSYKLNPEFLGSIWKRALAQGFRWPGFNRLTLSEKDKVYYEKVRKIGPD